MTEKLALTIAETAERLGISERTVRRQIKAGTIPVVRYGPLTVRVPVHALEQSLRQAATA